MSNKPSSRILEELLRTDGLPAYNTKAVQEIIGDTLSISDDLQEVLLTGIDGGTDNSSAIHMSTGTAASAMVYRATINRNKRSLLAYHAHRADRIELQIWTEGGTLSMDQRSKMSNEEIDYATGYANLIATYQDAEDTDLRMDFRPPKYDKVLVRALTDCGEVMLGRGTSRVLRAGDICLLSRTDAEPYILRNQMQEMSFEN